MQEPSSASTCTRCVNDQSVPQIRFNSDGLCSYCTEFDEWKDRLTGVDALHPLWTGRIERHRGEGPYDALSGLSGGKDSSYVLFHLVRTYGLRVKAVTFDNGFLTEWAKENIERIVGELAVDHAYVTLPKPAMDQLYLMSLKTTGALCTACAYATFSRTLAIATDEGIPMVVHGRSPAQMLRFFTKNTKDPFVPFLVAGLAAPCASSLKETYGRVVEAMTRTMPPERLEHFRRLFPDFASKQPAELVAYFLYHRYDEQEILGFLEANVGWRRHPDHEILRHFDCGACDASNYLSELAEGRPHIMPEVAATVRLGTISRDEGLRRLERERFTATPGASLQAVARSLGRAPEELTAFATEVRSRLGTRA